MLDVRDSLDVMIRQSGMKKVVIAERAGMTAQQLTDITQKRRKLEANEMINICKVLGRTPNDLLISDAMSGQDAG